MRYDDLIAQVQARAALPTRGTAEGVTRATLQTLSEDLPTSTVDTLAAELPREALGYLKGGGEPSAAPGALTEPEFVRRVADRSRANERHAAAGARSVIAVLRDSVSDQAARDLERCLPQGLAGSSGADQPHPGKPAHDSSSTRMIHDESVEGSAAVSVVLRPRVRGAAVWSGVAVTMAGWMLLEVVLFALGRTTLATAGITYIEGSTWVWSTLAAAIAMAVGGLTVGAAARWRSAGTVTLHALITWATSVIVAVAFTTFSSGFSFGPIGRLLITFRIALGGSAIDPAALASAQQTAGRAALSLVIALAACLIGALIGWRLMAQRSARSVS